MTFYNRFTVICACLLGTTALFWMTASLALEEASQDWREELTQIDAELKSAEDLKNRYLADARRAEDQGMRWQFMQNEKQEAKRAFERADSKKQAAQMLQKRIDVLNARKAEILKEHPEANDVQRSS